MAYEDLISDDNWFGNTKASELAEFLRRASLPFTAPAQIPMLAAEAGASYVENGAPSPEISTNPVSEYLFSPPSKMAPPSARVGISGKAVGSPIPSSRAGISGEVPPPDPYAGVTPSSESSYLAKLNEERTQAPGAKSPVFDTSDLAGIRERNPGPMSSFSSPQIDSMLRQEEQGRNLAEQKNKTALAQSKRDQKMADDPSYEAEVSRAKTAPGDFYNQWKQGGGDPESIAHRMAAVVSSKLGRELTQAEKLAIADEALAAFAGSGRGVVAPQANPLLQ